MKERMKKDRDRVENMAPTKQAVHKKTTDRLGPRSQKFEIEYDTVEYVDRTGNELLANWKCLVQEKEEAIQTTSNKLQNMQPNKLSENRLRQEIEQYIDFIEADRHVMKRCMQNLQISMKDRLDYLRKQKQFFLDKQKTLKNVYKTIERSNRSRIPNPFPQFILDVKREHYQLFNEELLISPNGSTNKYKRQMIEANTVIIDDTTLYIGRTGRTNVMTPIHENILESDKCITGECVDSCCTLRRSESELSFLNHEFEVEYNMFELSLESKETENCARKEETQRNELQIHVKKSIIPVAVKLTQLLANKQMKYEEKSPSTPVKPPLLLPNKNIKYVEDSYSETLKLQPLLPNTKIIYAKEPSDTTLKLPPLLPYKEQTCMQEHLYPNRPDTPKLLPLLQNLPQNIKKTLIVNKIRDESKDKSKGMPTESMSKPAPQQPAEKKAPNKVLDMTPELVSKTVRWTTKYQTFKLQKASRKNDYASDRKYRFSRLHISSGNKCYIPKSKSDKVRKMGYERYCTKRTQNKYEGKQTDKEKTNRYPETTQIHTLPQNIRETYIENKVRNEKEEKSKVIPTQSTSISNPQKIAETTENGETFDVNSELPSKREDWENKFPTFRLQKASGKDCFISERKYRFSRLNKSSGKKCYIPKSKSDKVSKIVTEKYCTTSTQKSNVKKQTETEKPDSYPAPDQSRTWPQNFRETLIVKEIRNVKKDNNEVVKSMPLSAPQQADKTTASNKMSQSAPEQTDDTTAFNKMSQSAQEQTDETTAINEMSKSTQQQADDTTPSNKFSKSTEQKTDETTAINEMSKSTQQQADDTTPSNKFSNQHNRKLMRQQLSMKSINEMSKSTQQQAEDTTPSNKFSKSTQQKTDETTALNKMCKSTEQQTDDSTALMTVSQSTQRQTDERMDSNKMPKSAQQQLFETTDSIKILNSTRKPNRNVRKQTLREKSASYLEPDQTHYMLDIAVDDKYPTEDIFLKLDDNELKGFYQVQEKDLFPVIENVSDIERIELFKKLHDQHIAVIQSNTVDNNQSSSSGSTLDDYQDAGQNGGTLKATMKSFVKKLIPDCITNGNQCHPTENLSSNWQMIKIRSGANIKTQFIPMPPNSPKPKTSNARRKRYGRKMDEHNNPPESLKTIRF
ncbi:unnamed protein product [Mytilus edulis]|uniref:Uncharacterized protein n=1 Tax=Mytilus edulis TaxID=6550 RepID=A0A8S3TGC6_MYTED|nr:unnamed protein product [Mytilus edulis]